MVPAAQLVAIAGQFGVDWTSNSGSDNVVLERAGLPLASGVLMAPLRAALVALGTPTHFEINLVGYAPPLIAPGDTVTAMVGSVDYNQSSGDFSALVTIAGSKTPASMLRVSGVVSELASIPVLTRLLAPRDAIGADDVTMVTMRLPADAAGIARSADQLVGQALRHVLPAGAAIPLSDLTLPLAVAANALVEMDLEAGGLSLQGRAIAEQAGALGDYIRVRNQSSLAVMLARITGPNRVRVDPDSQPIVAANNQEYAER